MGASTPDHIRLVSGAGEEEAWSAAFSSSSALVSPSAEEEVPARGKNIRSRPLAFLTARARGRARAHYVGIFQGRREAGPLWSEQPRESWPSLAAGGQGTEAELPGGARG